MKGTPSYLIQETSQGDLHFRRVLNMHFSKTVRDKCLFTP
jgi:hypothetical protein